MQIIFRWFWGEHKYGEERENSVDGLLTVVEPEWNVHRCLLYLLNFSMCLKFFKMKSCVRAEYFPPEVENKASMSFSTLLFSIMLESLASTIGKKKKEKAHRVERTVEGELLPLELLGSGAMVFFDCFM